MDCSTPIFSVLQYLTGVCLDSCSLSQWCHPTISSSVAPFSSHPQSFPASGAFPQWAGSSYQVAKVLELQLQHQSFQWIFSADPLCDLLVWPLCCPRDSQEFSLAPQFESINSRVLSLLYGPTLTSVHDYWKNHSFDYMGLGQQRIATVIFPGVICDCVIILLKSFQRPWEVWMIKTILPREHRPGIQVHGQGSWSVGKEPSPSLGGFFAQQPQPHHLTAHWTDPFHFLFWSL